MIIGSWVFAPACTDVYKGASVMKPHNYMTAKGCLHRTLPWAGAHAYLSNSEGLAATLLSLVTCSGMPTLMCNTVLYNSMEY